MAPLKQSSDGGLGGGCLGGDRLVNCLAAVDQFSSHHSYDEDSLCLKHTEEDICVSMTESEIDSEESDSSVLSVYSESESGLISKTNDSSK